MSLGQLHSDIMCEVLIRQGQCRSGADNTRLLHPVEGSQLRDPSEGSEHFELEPASPASHQVIVATQGSSSGDAPDDICNGQPDTATETVHLEMNQAIAAAVASAAVSAVIESLAAADRAALLVRAHEQQAALELKRQQKEAEVRETTVAHFRVRIAAMQIARHWKSWRHSPTWSKRSVAATVIQAHARGALVRQNLPKLHRTASCMKQVCFKIEV